MDCFLGFCTSCPVPLQRVEALDNPKEGRADPGKVGDGREPSRAMREESRPKDGNGKKSTYMRTRTAKVVMDQESIQSI